RPIAVRFKNCLRELGMVSSSFVRSGVRSRPEEHTRLDVPRGRGDGGFMAPPTDRPVWFVHRNGKQEGPFTFAELQQAAATRRLAPSDGIWREGARGGAPAGTVAGVFPPGAPPAAAAAPGPAPGVPGQAPPRPTGLKFHLHRAVEWNLRNVEVRPAE